MRDRVRELLRRFAIILEFFIAGLLCLAVLYFTFRLLMGFLQVEGYPIYGTFESFLNTAFSLVIGVEMIRMTCEHSAENVFEVLTFAIARQIVIDHTHAIDNVYGIIAIALLFATRKYLFIPHREKRASAASPAAAEQDEHQPV